ncbi:MAG: ATP-binding protein, partial [Pseudomonadota bacterium]
MSYRLAPRSLYARVVLIVILPIFLLLSFVTYLFFDRHWQLVSSNLSANVAGQIALVADLYAQGGPSARARADADARDNLDLTVRFEPGASLPETDKTSFLGIENATFDRQLDEKLDRPYWLNTASWPAYIEVQVLLDDGVLVYYARRDRIYVTTGPAFILWLVGATLLLGWIAIIFLRNQVRSIQRLATAAEAFGRGRDAPDFRPTGATEVRRAGRAFIAMRKRIERHLEQRTAMLAGVSHDLKTPLTRMKLALAMQDDDPAAEGLKRDVEQMEAMLEGYLDFARGLAEDDDEETFDLDAFCDDVVDAAARAGDALVVAYPDGAEVTGRRTALFRAVTNLVGNGFKYADHVWLTAEQTETHTVFAVDDDGEGIDPEHYEEAFRPCARRQVARKTNHGGGGRGVAGVGGVARPPGGGKGLW